MYKGIHYTSSGLPRYLLTIHSAWTKDNLGIHAFLNSAQPPDSAKGLQCTTSVKGSQQPPAPLLKKFVNLFVVCLMLLAEVYTCISCQWSAILDGLASAAVFIVSVLSIKNE